MSSNSCQVDRDNLINDPEIVSTISCQGRATWSDPPDPRCTRGREKDSGGRERKRNVAGEMVEEPGRGGKPQGVRGGRERRRRGSKSAGRLPHTLRIPRCGGDRGALSPPVAPLAAFRPLHPRRGQRSGGCRDAVVMATRAPVGMKHRGPTVALIAAPVDHHSVATDVEGVNTNPPLPVTRARSPPHTHYGPRIRTEARVQVWTYVLMRGWRE